MMLNKIYLLYYWYHTRREYEINRNIWLSICKISEIYLHSVEDIQYFGCQQKTIIKMKKSYRYQQISVYTSHKKYKSTISIHLYLKTAVM